MPLTRASIAPALPWLLGLLLLLIVAAAVSGIWAGNRWAEGAQAIKDRKAQQTYIEQLQGETNVLRQLAADSALDYAAATDRMDAIATQLETDREANRKHDATQREALAKLLRDRPDLRDGRAGDDVLRHWNRSNQGPAASGAAPGAKPSATPGVPGASAGYLGSVGGAAGQPRPGDDAVSRLQGVAGAAGASRRGMAADSVGLVLPVAGAAAAAGVP